MNEETKPVITYNLPIETPVIYNTGKDVRILITLDKLRIALRDFEAGTTANWQIGTPAGILISSLAAYQSTASGSFYWMSFWLAAIFTSAIFTVMAVIKVQNTKKITVEKLISNLIETSTIVPSK